MYFDTHVTTKFAKVIKQSFNNFFVFWRFGIAQKVIYNQAESGPTIFLLWVRCFNEPFVFQELSYLWFIKDTGFYFFIA